MSSKNKNNSIVFLTTLSVYLGLVLVGAPAHVLAQHNKIVSRRAKTADNNSDSKNKVEKGVCSELSSAEIIKLLAKYDVNSTPFDFSYQVDYLENQPANLQIVLAQGDKSFVESFRRIIACNQNQKETLKDKEIQDQFAKEVKQTLSKSLFAFTSSFSNYKVNAQEIAFNKTLTFADSETAKNFADFNKSALEHAHKIEIEFPELVAENKLQSAILNNTTFSFAGNQVFIVTRLPRGSLDALLANK